MFGRLSFGLAVILLIAATSMSRRQNYGVGWLNGECYLVKGGTFAGSAILVLVSVGSVNGSAFSTIKTSQADQHTKIHKQMGWHYSFENLIEEKQPHLLVQTSQQIRKRI